MAPVGHLGAAAGPEIGCTMHWVVVETTEACWVMRLCIMRACRNPTGRCSTTHYHRKTMENMDFHWFLMISIGFWWFSLVFDDFHWFLMIFMDFWWITKLLRWSRRPARPQGAAPVAPDVQPHVSACPSGPSYHSIHRATNLRPYKSPEAADRRHVKKSIPFILKSELRKKQNYIYMVSSLYSEAGFSTV